METIHLKTADPVSQQLLRSAAQRGIDLFWDRYEKAQPQDGFMRLGLYCPFACMYGPCRIDPFGRGPALGICGLDRDQMVAATMLRLCHQGAMQALAAAPHCTGSDGLASSSVLGALIDTALSATQQETLCCSEIFETAGLLQRSSPSHEELLTRALRLGLLTLALVEQASTPAGADTLECSLGYGVFPEAGVRIGFSGRPPRDLIQALEQALLKEPESPAVLLSLGDWLQVDDRFIPIGTTSGEAELVLSSGAIHLLVAGPGTDPGLLHVSEQTGVPVVLNNTTPDVTDILKRARTRAELSSHPDPFTDVSAELLTRVIMSATSFSKAVVSDSADQVALIGGSDTPHLPLGSLTADLVSGLADSGIRIAGWGDTALWMAKQTQAEAPGQQPLTLENGQGPLLAVKGLAAAGKLDALRGICFTGIKDVKDFSMALGLAYLGCRVSMATPIPVQGSKNVVHSLARMIGDHGGELLHFDHPAEAESLTDWFTAV